MPLSPRQVSSYQEQGFLLPKQQLFANDRFQALQNRFETLLAEWQDTYGQAAEEMDKPHWYFPELFEYLCDESVLDMIEQLIGPDIVLFTSHFICKPAGIGRRVPWHEDSGYWQNILTPMGDPVTIWLALDPSTTENGCLRIIPGSHKNADLDYTPVPDPKDSVFPTEIAPNQFDESSAVNLELAPGEFSLHHAGIIHGSHANKSQQRRCGFTMRYFSSHSKFNHEMLDEHFQIYLVRGKDHASNTYSEPGKLNRTAVEALLHPV